MWKIRVYLFTLNHGDKNHHDLKITFKIYNSIQVL